jgi:RNA polymerase sigma factor (sigma-70 family)
VRSRHGWSARTAWVGSRDLAEEATQQTFMKAWRAAATFDPARELRPWLATIARRTAIDIHRREARRPTERLDDAAMARLPDGVDRSFDVWAVREAIDELPPLEREVVRLQHLESLTHAEIGTRLGVPVGTIKSRSFRAHHRLAARLRNLRPSSGSARRTVDCRKGDPLRPDRKVNRPAAWPNPVRLARAGSLRRGGGARVRLGWPG